MPKGSTEITLASSTWKVHTPNLLNEALNNKGSEMLVIPMRILMRLLYSVAERASELNDPKLNSLMARMALYAVADPESPHYDAAVASELWNFTESNGKGGHH